MNTIDKWSYARVERDWLERISQPPQGQERPCPDCNGSGEARHVGFCRTCGGSGILMEARR